MSFLSKLIGYMSTIIQFKDINVKEALLASSDINPDGTREITYEEASSNNITGTILKNALNPDHTNSPNTNIVSFDEFQYFKGVTTIAEYFLSGCTNLKSIKFPYTTINGFCILHNTAITKLDLTGVIILDCNDRNNSLFGKITTLTEVWIPDVTNINRYVFTKEHHPNIEKIIVSSAAQWINISVVSGIGSNPNVTPNCSGKASLYRNTINGLEKITKFDTTGKTTLRPNLFEGLKDIEEIEIKENNTVVGDSCFKDLNYSFILKGYDKISSVGTAAFANCKANEDTGGLINIPLSATALLGNCFANSTLKKAESDSVTRIGGACFERSEIVAVKLDYLTTIDPSGSFSLGPFTNCKSLVSASLDSLQSLYIYSFYGCTALVTASLMLCTNIGTSGFYNCTALVTIKAPLAVVFGDSCFYKCSNITAGQDFFNLENAQTIGVEAFYLSSINMPSNFYYLSSVGDAAFKNCSTSATYIVLHKSDSIVTFKPHTIPANRYDINTFAGVTTIYVPDALLTSYQSDTNWGAMINKGITFVGISQLST